MRACLLLALPPHAGSASLAPYDGWAEDETCFNETKVGGLGAGGSLIDYLGLGLHSLGYPA